MEELSSQSYFSESLDSDSWDEVLQRELDEHEDYAFGRTFGDYQIGEIIGQGSQGCVYKGLNLKNGRFVAIKQLDLRKQDFEDDEVKNTLLEIELLKDLNHPNIVKLIDYHHEEFKFLRIVLEYIENGSLKDILQKFGYFPERLVSKYSFQVLQGLSYLHEKDVIHRDIKGANILITKEGVCKLADFGVAMKIEPDVPITAVGSPYWIAPEIIEMKESTKASDVWSFGCLVLELLTGRPPYGHLKPIVAMMQILEDDQPPFPPNISTDLSSFLDGIFQKEPRNRLTINELLDHAWIRSYNTSNFNQSTLHNLSEFLNLQCEDEVLLANIQASVSHHPQDFLAKITHKNRAQALNLMELDITSLKEKIASFQLENDLLSTACHTIQRELLQLEEINRNIASNIELLEDHFVISDQELANLIYGDKLSISELSFGNVSKGVLMTCKLRTKSQTKLRWVKRYVVLQDNFLFLYRDGDEEGEPVDIIKIRGARVDVNVESNRKYSFSLTSGINMYIFSAASASVLMKWLNLLENISDWYTSEIKLSDRKSMHSTSWNRISQDLKLDLKLFPRKNSNTFNPPHLYPP